MLYHDPRQNENINFIFYRRTFMYRIFDKVYIETLFDFIWVSYFF